MASGGSLKSRIGLRVAGFLCLAVFACFQGRGLAQEGSVATVGFNFSFPGSQPENYSISIPAQGGARYDSASKLSAEQDSDPFHMTFTISDSTRARVFALAKRAHYFETDVDSKKNGLASTGVKTLIYQDGEKNTQATYNYSPVAAVQELTSLFQNLSTTLEFGHRLEYYHRYQKLALDDELKRMEEMVKQASLQDLAVIAPILQLIARDPSVINPVRARAQRMLDRAGIGEKPRVSD